MNVVDLFAGPGGWDVAARELGMEPLGIEWDDAACETRQAAGLRTLNADVATLDPLEFVTVRGDPVTGLIASPPCQAFSMAGKGEGRKAIDEYVASIDCWGRGEWSLDDARSNVREKCADERAHLVLESLRWALALEPMWIAFEQVEPVLPIWRAMAEVLRDRGYSVWTGVLSAECYGVPQTRRRAFLIASRSRIVKMPMPTHQRYIAPVKERQDVGLFDAGERSRIVHPDDRHLLPWVSMAEALGWGMTEHPCVTLAMGTATGGPSLYGGSGARETLEREREVGRWAPTEYNSRDQADSRSGERVPARRRGVDEPAPTVSGASRSDTWVGERPATTIACESRVFQPGGHHEPGQQSENAIRVTQQEAAVLQSFPADYPWQGSKTKQFEQIGNAVPPKLAEAVLREAIGSDFVTTNEVEKSEVAA